MRVLTLILLIILIAATSGCCNQYDKAERNACLKFWYGLEPDPQDPDVYKHGLDLWKDEAFGPESGWQKTWIKLFGSAEEKEKFKSK